jgi:tRNA-dihydrouridine synthase B
MRYPSFWDKLEQPVIALAPMDGVTDAPNRTMHGLYGRPDVVLTEFTNVEGLWRGSERIYRDFLYTPAERPVVAQIFGCRPEYFYRAAHVVCELGFDGVDINMGCPSRTVANKGGGAALIRVPDTARAIIKATQQGVRDWYNGQTLADLEMDDERIRRIRLMNDERISAWGDRPPAERRLLPVSVKTRLGYDSVVITDWVQDLLELEPHAISIHGRTLAQHYKGEANWDAIAAAAAIVRQTPTLIFGNGDITSLYQAAQRIRTSGKLKTLLNAGKLPGVEDLPGVAPSREERLLMALEHARVHARLKGEDHFVELRKHMGWYLGHFHGAKRVRNELVRINSLADVERVIQAALERQDDIDTDADDPLMRELRDPEADLSCAL